MFFTLHVHGSCFTKRNVVLPTLFDVFMQVEKTTWDWELINTNKPIWSRKPKDVKDEEYNEFYKSFTKVILSIRH